MTAFLRCYPLIVAQTVREVLLSRRTLLFVALALAYPVVAIVAAQRLGDSRRVDELFCGVTFGVYFQGLVPIVSMFFAVSTVREEIASRTLVYLITGPVPRAAIWLGKFTAAVLVCWLILGSALAIAICVLPMIGEPGWRGDASITRATLLAPILPALLAPVAYCAIGTVFGVRFQRAMITGAVYVVGWEYVVGSTPAQAGVRSLTVVDSARAMFFHGVDPEAAREFRRTMLLWASGGRRNISIDLIPSIPEAVWNLAILAGVALALALWFGLRRDYDSASTDD
ncbi:MAG: ABC transporter permease [Planctomycetes bacterium]|nr:ABC transporter permease [Planctomycetota bacterium]MCB9919409.1 ABC transporter permease [Planctomycetota bacterium]